MNGLDGTTAAVLALSLSGTALSCTLGAYLVYKVRQIHVTLYGTEYQIRKVSQSVTKNLELREILTHELGFDRPLPLLRGWAASPDVLLLLARRVRSAMPATIVECGSGVSTIVQAQAARLNGRGHVYSFDHDAAFAEKTRSALGEFGLSDWATVTHAPLVRGDIGDEIWEWYDLRAIPNVGPIDQLFIDGPPADSPRPMARYPAGPVLFPLLSPGAAVFVDDADRPGEVEIMHRWSLEFPGLIPFGHDCEKGCLELRRTSGRRSEPRRTGGSGHDPASEFDRLSAGPAPAE